MARALATGPRLLLLDEVAGGLTDPEVAELVEIVRGINRTGVAVVWIEHVVRALLSSVDRLICLAVGQLIADGEPREVLARQQVQGDLPRDRLDGRRRKSAAGPAPPAAPLPGPAGPAKDAP